MAAAAEFPSDVRFESPTRASRRRPNRDVPQASEASNHFGHSYRFVSEPVDDDANPNATPIEAQLTPSSTLAQNESGSSIKVNVGGGDIIIQFTPAGMLIASEDQEALDAFQTLFESLAAPSALQSELPTIIWLKYIKADVAAELISSVLGGGESSISSAVDSVTSGFGGGMLGLLGMGGGSGDASTAKSVLTSTGSVNIVPDARLNALIIQANPIDLQMIELILEKIDIQESPEDIETVAKPALIPGDLSKCERRRRGRQVGLRRSDRRRAEQWFSRRRRWRRRRRTTVAPRFHQRAAHAGGGGGGRGGRGNAPDQ